MDGWVSIYTKIQYGTCRRVGLVICYNIMMSVVLWDWFVGDGMR